MLAAMSAAGLPARSSARSSADFSWSIVLSFFLLCPSCCILFLICRHFCALSDAPRSVIIRRREGRASLSSVWLPVCVRVLRVNGRLASPDGVTSLFLRCPGLSHRPRQAARLFQGLSCPAWLWLSSSETPC